MNEIAVITPIIRQHASDAAFYWQQITQSKFSVLQDNHDLEKFHEYLNANLDGLLIAGDAGWNEAFKSLKRWKTQGETFVCSYLAHHTGNEVYLKMCWDIVKLSPITTLQGYISALVSLPYTTVQSYLSSLQHNSNELELCVLLGGEAGHQHHLSQSAIDVCLHHNDAEVQAAVCHYVQALRLKDFIPNLYSLNQSESLLVQYASATALCRMDSASLSMVNVLHKSIQSYLNALPPKGLAGLLHHRRLEEMTRLAGQVCSVQTSCASTFLDRLPTYLKVLFLGHYGHSEYLSFLLDLLEDDELGRLAFWAIHMLTGLDINEAQYLINVDEDELEHKPLHRRSVQLGIGIGKPNSQMIRKACQDMSLPEQIVLLGKTISEKHCYEILKQGKQVERYIASWHHAQLSPLNQPIDIQLIDHFRGKAYAAFTRK